MKDFNYLIQEAAALGSDLRIVYDSCFYIVIVADDWGERVRTYTSKEKALHTITEAIKLTKQFNAEYTPKINVSTALTCINQA